MHNPSPSQLAGRRGSTFASRGPRRGSTAAQSSRTLEECAVIAAPAAVEAAAPTPAAAPSVGALLAVGVTHRYSHLMSAALSDEFRTAFSMFDYDGGGDVDMRELGLMFRKLGYAPSEAEMHETIREWDYDGSGTIDFEEFCGMMLSAKRSEAAPAFIDELRERGDIVIDHEPGDTEPPLSLE